MKYKVTQEGRDLFFPEGELLGRCLQKLANFVADYSGMDASDVSCCAAHGEGFRIVVHI